MYIIRNLLRYIISPYGCISSSRRKCTLARDEIQGRLAALDDIHDCVVMICQACGLCTTKCMFDAIRLERDMPECSNMVRTEDKVKAMLPYVGKQALKITKKKSK